MPASSLIFVVIVAIWAVSLLQYGVRRRQRAAAARSVDGFSEAMRVLEKNTVLPSSAEPVSRPRSYVVAMGRPSRPSVEVKRATPAGRLAASTAPAATGPTSPLIARRASRSLAPDPNVIGEVDPVHHSEPHRPEQYESQERQPFFTPLRQRQLRALLLLGALLWVPVSLVLAITGTLMWVSFPLALATLAAVLYWLVVEAQADRARRDGRSDAAPAQSASRRRLRRPQVQRPLSSEETQVIRDLRPQRTERPGQAASASERPAAAAAAFDIDAYEAQVASVAPAAEPVAAGEAIEQPVAESAQVAEEPAPGTWSPVPVPRPTYAMKAKAEPTYTSAGIPADVFDTPEFADEADELDDRALFARRAVGG